MRKFHYFSLLLVCAGCVDEKEPSSDRQRDAAIVDATLLDLGTDGAMNDDAGESDGTRPDGALDAEVDPDGTTEAGLDAGAPDQMLPLEIDDCPSACARVMACERVDLYPDEPSCVAACERASRRDPPTPWFDCLEFEACPLLHLCRLPEPPPLTCDEVCDGLVDCGEEAPFDCLAACEEGNADGAFAQCGEFLYGGACDAAPFWECIGDNIYPDCEFRCEVGIECNVLRAENCVLECIGEMGSADPLRALRARQSNQCIRAAQRDCRRVDACVNIEDAPAPIVVTRQGFCADWNRCFANIIPCEFIWDQFPNREQMAACVMRLVRDEGCPADPNIAFQQCLEAGGPQGPGCNDICEAQATCDQLPEGQDQFACVRDCNNILQMGDGEAIERLSALFPCGTAASCDDLAACLEESSPLSSCAAHCARLDDCELGDEDCVQRCDDRFFRLRDTAHRQCVRDAADCAAVAACAVPPELDCARLCVRLADCGGGGEGCVEQCDDDLFTAPRATIEIAACALAAPTCAGPEPSVASCPRESSAGARCARYCLALNQCDPTAAAATTSCLEACGDGYIGAEAIRFAAAGPCLDAAEADAECPVLEACIPDPVIPDCPAWCAALEGCDLAHAECAGQCPDDVLAQIRSFEQGACMGEDPECDAVEACMGDASPVDVEPANLANFCAQWQACGYQGLGPCELFWQGLDPEAAACVIAQMQVCPPNPIDAFEQCQREPVGGGSSEVLAACAALCHTQLQCDAPQEGVTIRTCTAQCYNTLFNGAREDILRLRGFLECRAALACNDLAACVAANSPEEACGAYCAALDACELADDGCPERCDAGFYRDRNEAARLCVLEAEGDCETIAACAPQSSLPCAYLCDRRDGCVRDDPDCLAECDDRHFADPVQMGRAFACGVTAPLCGGLIGNAMSGCDDVSAAGGACWRYCWARTGCDASDGATLGACLVACGEGVVGGEGLQFAASQECLADVDAALADEARCAAAADCIPEEVAVDCVPWCAALDECEAAVEGCAEACPADALSLLRVVTQRACVADAAEDCDEVEACLGSELPVEAPPLDPLAFCVVFRACGLENFIPCEQLLPLVQNQPGALECAMDNLDPCPIDPVALFNQCFGPGLNPNPQPRLDYGAVCARLCQAQAECGALATHARDCAAACINGLDAEEEGLLHGLVACRDALDCPTLAACSAAAFGDDCDAPCNQYLGCGGEDFADLGACRATCNAARIHPRAGRNYVARVGECLTALLGEDGDDQALCAADGRACFVPERRVGVLSCEDLCPVLVRCGFEDIQECLQGCEEADRENPEQNEAVRACLTEMVEDGGCNRALMEACFEDGEDREMPPPPPGPPIPFPGP